MKGKVIFEAAGSPKEFVKEFLNRLLEDIKKFEGIDVVSYHIEEPIEKEVNRDGKKVKMFTSFMESEIEFKDIDKLFEFVLMYSPSSIEVYDIDDITLSKEKLNTLLNDICMRVIQLTLTIQELKAQNQLLLERLSRIAPRFVQGK